MSWLTIDHISEDRVERGARIGRRGHTQRGRGAGLGRVMWAWHETRSR
jgi:hypothetical protein